MAIEQTGGLDAVETPSVASSTALSGLPAAGPVVKPAASKSGIGLGATTLNPTQTAELLANMQSMIDKRSGGWSDFMSGLQDAAAWAVPGLHGQKAQALDYRNRQKAQDAKDVFEMRNQMAMLKASQAQSENIGKQLDALVAGGGSGGAGGAGGAIPDSVLQRIAALRARGDNAGAAAAYDDYLKTKTNERLKLESQPGYFEQKPYDTGRGTFMMNVPQIEEFRRTGRIPDEVNAPGLSGAAKGAPQLQSDFAKLVERTEGSPEGSVSPKGATTSMQVMPGTARAPGYGVRPAADNSPEEVKRVGNDYADAMLKRYKGDTEAALIAYNAGPVVADKFLASNRDPAVLPKETVAYLARANTIQNEKPTQVAAAPTGTMTDAQPPVRRPGESVDAFKQRQELFKKQAETNIETAATSGVESRKKAGDMIAAVEQNAKNADEVIRTADRVITHATKHPKEFGYGYQQENAPLAIAANIPGIGAITEKAVPALLGAPGESERRATTNTDASKLGLDFAAQMFSGTGARLGVGLEQMAANAKGVGTDLPAATNALNANLVKVAAEKAKEQAAAWRAWRATHGGDNADPYQFMQSAENKAIVHKFDKKLDSFEEEAKRIYPQFFGEKAGPKKERKSLGAILGGGQ